jgi:hypothetical protein
MDRRVFLVPSAAFLLGVALLLALVGPPHTFSGAVLTTCFLLAGLCLGAGALRESVTVAGRDVPWYAFVGAGDVALAAGMAVNAARIGVEGGSDDLFLAVVAGAGAVPLFFIGVDYLRGGRHFDLSAFE